MKNNIIQDIRKSRIARKLALYVVLASTLITIFTSAYQLYGIYKSDISSIELRLNEIRDSYSENIALRVWIANIEELNQSLEGILRLSDIEFIEVYEGDELISIQGIIPETDIIERTFPLSYTYHNKTQIIGRMRITASLASTYQRLFDRAVNIIVSNAIKTFLISSFMLFIFYVLVVKHLQRITEYAEGIDRHNLKRRLKLERAENDNHNQDEFDMLVDAVHSMQLNMDTSISLLSQSEKTLSLTLDSMNDAVITITDKGIIVSFNKAAEKIFGYSYDDIIGDNVKKIIPNKYAKSHNEDLNGFVNAGYFSVMNSYHEVEGIKKNDEIFPLMLSISELPINIQGQRHFIGTCRDLTGVKQQEEKLRRSQKMDALGELTGGVAHDYNNMLGVVLGYAELLKIDFEHDSKHFKFVEQIEYAAERGASLTRKLLSFSRDNRAEENSVNLNTLLKEQEDLLSKTLTVSIQLDMTFGAGLWPILTNSSDLEDTILNMAINAMHAMSDIESKAKLHFITSNITFNDAQGSKHGLNAGDYVHLSICDTGHGMPESIKEKIFDPFYSTKGEKGTGLGLSQVLGFMQSLGGNIEVSSKVGHGTEFSLYFPRYYEGTLKTGVRNNAAENILKGSQTILVVDDEVALCDLCGKILKGNGYKIFKANNAKEALKIIDDEHIDLMVSDILMPDMNGYELSQLVKEKHPEIKIQLVSGYSGGQHNSIKDNKLHDNLLHKPYSSHDLLKKIKQAFNASDE